ncbi:MAG: AAA domain-containing protein [Flavobacteriales bacterium]|nr:AAA domain-containing protein [Flavobacteriales bacterium]
MPIIPSDISEMLFLRLKESIEKEKTASIEAFQTLSSVFETAIASLLDGEMRVFSSSYSRVVYACRLHNVSAEKERMALVFRMRQSDIQQNATNQEQYLKALSTLVIFLEYITEKNIPDSIKELIKDVVPYEFGHYHPKTEKANIIGTVVYKSELRTENSSQYFWIKIIPSQINDERENLPESLSVYFTIDNEKKGNKRSDFFSLFSMLKMYNSVNVINVSAGKTEDVYMSKADTLVVLEPDYLVDVTDIAGCFTSLGANSKLFLLSKLHHSADSEAMLKGTLINALLDATLKDETAQVDDVFREALNENVLKSVCYGGQAVKNIWDSVLREHSNNIQIFAKSIQGQRVTVEPSFISPLYGIQGRLDVLAEDRNDSLRKDIYELKSGKAPFGSTLWQPNSIQVACYNMLLESTYGKDRRGTSAVFYSSAQASPLRNSLSSMAEKIQICAVRNEIIFEIYNLAEENYDALKSINLEDIGSFAPFDKVKIEEFAAFYNSLKKTEKAYYQSFISFYIREMITAKTGSLLSADRDDKMSYSSLWKGSVGEKLSNFAILPLLTIENYSAKDRQIHLKIDEKIEHTFRNGDVAVLYPFLGGNMDVASNQVIKGVIELINDEEIVFSPRGQVDQAYLESYKTWMIEHDMMEKNYWTAISGLFDFLLHKSHAKDVVFNHLLPSETSFVYKQNPRFTENQNQAIEKALKADDFFLLQGPPGTGKTSAALMGIVSNILDNTSQNIVLLAFTNRAVEEIAIKLRKNGIDFLRVGHQNNEDISISKIARGKKINEIRGILTSKRVILSTVSAFSTRVEDLNKIMKFDNVIIDEASQLTEIQVVGVLHYFKKFILIGDQLQLSSVVAQSEKYCKVKEPLLMKMGFIDMRASLFERLYAWCEKNGYGEHYAILDTHFRMHSKIADLVNVYYKGALKCGSKRQFEDSDEPRLVFYPSVYQPTYKKHEGEAKLVSSLLLEIKNKYRNSFSSDTVGVITPWRAQIATVKNEITDSEILEKVTIDTVERFQGGEKDIIIATMAVFNPKQMCMIQSFDAEKRVDRKLNVLLSRAREKIIIIGYEPVLSSNEQYRNVLSKMTKMDFMK